MKLSFQIPKKNASKLFFHFAAISFIVFSFSILEKLTRSSDDIYKSKNICGFVNNYYFSKPGRSYATWRLRIISEQGKTEVFEVGSSYIQSKISKITMTKGKEICIEYLTTDYIFGDQFITQIYLQDKALLDQKDIISGYMKKPSGIELYLAAFFLILTLFFVIKVKRN